MSKHIKFEKVFRQTNEDIMRSTVKQSGIILGYGSVMSIEEVEQWIKNSKEFIEERKEDIRVAEASIELYKKEFTNK
jgi:hypothetical protein